MTDDVERPRVAAALLAKLRRRVRSMPPGDERDATAERVRALRNEVAGYVEAKLLPPSTLEAA